MGTVSCEDAVEQADCLIRETLSSLNTLAMSEVVQEELSKSITTLQRVRRCLIVAKHRKRFVQQAQLELIAANLETAIAALQRTPCQLLFARRLRRDAEFAIREFRNPIFGSVINSFKYLLYESSTPVKVLFGLGLAVPLYLMVPALKYQEIVVKPILKPVLEETQTHAPGLGERKSEQRLTTKRITQFDVDETIALLVLAGVAGSLGSIVSILTRIKEYETEKYTDAVLPIYIGALKPLIGGAFGILLFTLISARLLPLQVADDARPINRWYALFAIAFVAGFSERLVKDIISQTEGKMLPAPSLPHDQATRSATASEASKLNSR